MFIIRTIKSMGKKIFYDGSDRKVNNSILNKFKFERGKKMMKKLISAFAALAMLVSSFTAVFANETNNTQTDYFEPSYAAEDWALNHSALSVRESDKRIICRNAVKNIVAEYKHGTMNGDFILAADLVISQSGVGNKIVFAVDDIKVAFRGDGTAVLYPKNGNPVISEVASTKDGAVIIRYDHTGNIKVYRPSTNNGEQLLIDYRDENISNESGTLSVSFDYVTGNVSNLRMYKPFEGSFSDDFTDTAMSAANWDLASGAYQLIQKTEANTLTGKYGLAPARKITNTETACAYIKNIFTTGSYSLSFDCLNTTKNVRRIYFNKTADKVGYELRLYGEKSDIAVALYKGEKITSADMRLASATVKSAITKVRVDYDSKASSIKVYFNGEETPTLTANDAIYTMGRIGFVAEFNDNPPQVWFKNIKVEPEKEVFKADDMVLSGKIESNSTVKSSTTVTNTTGEAKSTDMVMAFYKDDVLQKVSVKPLEFAAHSGKTPVSADMTLGTLEENGKYGVKCFLLDSIASMKPLVRAVSKYNQSQLILVGDSICQAYSADSAKKGWGQYAQETYDEKYVKVVNKAYAGYTTDNFIKGDGAGGAEYSWEKIKELINPGDTVFINLGINDMSKIRKTTDGSYTADNYKENLTTMVKDAKAKGANVALISSSVGIIGKYLSNGETETYMTDVANDTNTVLLKLNSKMKTEINNKYPGMAGNTDDPQWKKLSSEYYVDGLHVNETGARFILDCINQLAKDADMAVTDYLKTA